VFYHCISRVVDRRFVLGAEEKEHFRMLMRMQEKFTGCRVVSYCLMDNHFHLWGQSPQANKRDLLEIVSAPIHSVDNQWLDVKGVGLHFSKSM
jgi:REP element-mobilizing transposase RayT